MTDDKKKPETTPSTKESHSSTPYNHRLTLSNQKLGFALYAMAFLTLCLTCLVANFVVENHSGGKPNGQVEMKNALYDAKPVAQFEKEAQVSDHTISELTTRFSLLLRTDVSIALVQGTDDWFAVRYGDTVLFTDARGSVLIKGDILTLKNNMIVSDLAKADYAAIMTRQRVMKSSHLTDVRTFGLGLYVDQPIRSVLKSAVEAESKTQTAHQVFKPVNKMMPPKLTKSKTENPSAKLAPPKAMVTRQVSLVPSESKITDVSAIKPDVPERKADFLTRKQNEIKTRLAELPMEQQCLQKIGQVQNLKSLYAIFKQMDKKERIQCGQVMAGVTIPNLKDENGYIIYPAKNPNHEVTFFSDYTCHHCRHDFAHIQELNDAGVTVRVYPFGRGEYREIVKQSDGSYHYTKNYTILGKNYVTAQCASDDMATKRRLFNELMDNPMKYKNATLPEAANIDFDSKCAINVLGSKLYGDLYTSRGTPMYVFDNGKVNRGTLSVSEVMKRFD